MGAGVILKDTEAAGKKGQNIWQKERCMGQ